MPVPALVPLLVAAATVTTVADVYAQDRTGLARVVTQAAEPGRCISRVAIRRIDGRSVHVPPQGFDLPPGRHTITGTVALDIRHCPLPHRGNIARPVAPLEVEVEAGKTYWIGFDHGAEDSSEWALVVWKEE